MVFSSMIFLWIFLPVTLGFYYLLAAFGLKRCMNILLLFMSLVFYSFGEPKYIILLLLSVVINYLGGLLIDRTSGRSRSTVLAVTVVLNLALLGYFKYYNFVAQNVLAVTGYQLLPVKNVVLPIGISFYTFQAMSYVIDLARGKCQVQKSFYKLLLYITFFPQLIAGPIVRYLDIAEQIDERSVSFEKFTGGVCRFIVGLGKKVLLANTFASAVDQAFALDGTDRSMGIAWFGMVLYAMQIYFDFSGYSDMAIGLGKMFGFEFLENFRLPYISASVQEFWRRWHISLSTWFREYLYIPLGGNRKGKARTYLNLWIVFLATGIWHGAGWTFILWGMIHGFFMVTERLFLGKWLEKNPVKLLNHLYTLFVVLVAWVFFRADSFRIACQYLKSMFLPGGSGTVGFGQIFGNKCLFLAAVGLALCGLIPETLQLKIRDNWGYRMLVLPCILLLCIMMLATNAYNPFIYFRF